ncbi:unnamed protein product [Camellia sinensis]
MRGLISGVSTQEGDDWRAYLNEYPYGREGELEQTLPGRTTAPIFDHASKIEHVLEKLCSQQSFHLLVQFWTPKILNGQYSLKTQNSQFFLKTSDDALCGYRKISSELDINCGEDSCFLGAVFSCQMPKVWSDHALASLCLPVKLPSNDPFLCQNCVGILEIVSKIEAVCQQVFKEGRVCELFQEVGLICSGLEPLDMQLHVSTQGSEVPSKFSVDHTSQFTTGQVFNSKNELINWVHDVAKNYGFGVAIKSSTYDKRPRIYLGCKSGMDTKKCICPFTVKASETNEKWSLKVIKGLHNHPLAEHREG